MVGGRGEWTPGLEQGPEASVPENDLQSDIRGANFVIEACNLASLQAHTVLLYPPPLKRVKPKHPELRQLLPADTGGPPLPTPATLSLPVVPASGCILVGQDHLRAAGDLPTA